jgi:ABC-2 type transport system permease protein
MFEDLVRAYYIALKDLKEYYMKPGTVSWGILFPVAFTLAFMVRRGGLTPWLAPGMIALAVFFGSTSMSAMSIVFERRLGSFERLMLYPISYNYIALGKTLSSFIMGLISLIPVLIVIYIVLPIPPMHPLLLVLALIVSAFASSAMGVLMSFLVKDPSQVMVVFNLVRFPMMFLSDIIIPVSDMPREALPVVLAQPLTYMAELIRYSMINSYDIIPPYLSLIVMILFTIILILFTGYTIDKSRP